MLPQLAFAEDAVKKTESNIILQKFGLAIILVVFFAFLIYLILFLYKKFIGIQGSRQNEYPSPDSLESAKNLNEAIQIFLEKTKPNQ